MNAIIALCHFCEVHGPSILFCTQAFHSNDPKLYFSAVDHSQTDDDLDERCGHISYPGLQRSFSTGSANQEQPDQTKGKSDLLTESEPSVRNAGKSTEQCEACSSFQAGHPGLLSTDYEAKVCYISSQKPRHPKVFTMVRQACVRSLSCEVCPGREGPIFFGDEHRGHVFSHTFYLKDTHARGLKSWYSIIVVMMDKIFLLNSWPFLVTHIRTVIGDMQEKSGKVYDAEQAKCPQQTHRLLNSMTPDNFRFKRGVSKQTRTLSEMTNDKRIFHKLHLAFTWILKAGGSRLTEKLLEGPPTEDSIIDMEKHEETEDGFVMIHVIKDKPNETVEKKSLESKHNNTEDASANLEARLGSCMGDLGNPENIHSNPVEKTFSQLSLSEVEEEGSPHSFRSLRHLLKVLGTYKFHELAHHVVIGNQVVIRSCNRALVKSVIDVLKLLLPKGCCRIIYYSDHYEDSWRCNFLGLTPGVTLPEHVDLFVTLDIIEPEPKDTDVLGASACLSTNPECAEFMGYTFMLNSPQTLPEKGPTVLLKMELSLLNDKLADSVVEQCLICTKEEWMNKVKVLFKFTKAGGNRSEDETRKLIQIVGAQNEDRAVLKFWMTGLSVQYRNHMLSSAINQNM